jgi:hypothetical protein
MMEEREILVVGWPHYIVAEVCAIFGALASNEAMGPLVCLMLFTDGVDSLAVQLCKWA